jgi:hypothetical protein
MQSMFASPGGSLGAMRSPSHCLAQNQFLSHRIHLGRKGQTYAMTAGRHSSNASRSKPSPWMNASICAAVEIQAHVERRKWPLHADCRQPQLCAAHLHGSAMLKRLQMRSRQVSAYIGVPNVCQSSQLCSHAYSYSYSCRLCKARSQASRSSEGQDFSQTRELHALRDVHWWQDGHTSTLPAEKLSHGYYWS